jgi:5-methylcytosine-specific restriction endonuclease McrA
MSKFRRAIDELDKLREWNNGLSRAKWYKSWSKWRRVLSETREYRLFRAQVIVRAEGYCEQCGADGEHVHHVIPVYKNLKLVTDPDNGRFLCAQCHNEQHNGTILPPPRSPVRERSERGAE